MKSISFSCEDCEAKFTSKSAYLATAEKQLHNAGWVDRLTEYKSPSGSIWRHVDRLCPKCKLLPRAILCRNADSEGEK